MIRLRDLGNVHNHCDFVRPWQVSYEVSSNVRVWLLGHQLEYKNSCWESSWYFVDTSCGLCDL